MILDTNNIVYKSKDCHMCRTMRVVTIYLCKHNIKPVLVGISQQSNRVVRPWSINSLLWAYIAI